MTRAGRFLPTRAVAVFAYPGVQSLDIVGAASVFAMANLLAGRPAYGVTVVSSRGGLVRAEGGLELGSRRGSTLPRSLDTVLVAGAEEAALVEAAADPTLRRQVVSATRRCRRYGSVCTGAFLLAAWGLLDGRRVATHWEGAARLAAQFPKLSVDADALFVEDGPVWTSAGVSTGIDMTLALVERDLGPALAGAVAQRLVLSSRRPGYQSQFSPLLRAQRKAPEALAELVAWMERHLHEGLGVDRLAKHAGQSPRSFHRAFRAATGQTPARFIGELRLERARALLPHRTNLKELADEVGFGNAVRLSRAFERRFGIPPSVFRALNAT